MEDTTPSRLRILIIDDSPEDRMVYRRLLTHEPPFPIEIVEAECGETGLKLARSEAPDCILLDYRLPDMDGLEVVAELKGGNAELPAPVILMTGQGSEPVAVSAMRAGVSDYVNKGQVSPKGLHRAITNTIEKDRLRRSLNEHRRRLEQTVQHLERRNDEIGNFYHTLSHELKSPLTAATEFVSLVLEGLAGPITDTQREYLEIAKQNCNRITVHINDILDATRLETGKLTLSRAPASVTALAGELVSTLTSRARERGIDLRLSTGEEVPDVDIDANRIVQVLSNLLNNALKFTPSNGEIRVRIEKSADHPGYVVVSVRDTGRGIAPEQLPLVFERLYQVADDDAATHGGLGMGLSICRDLVAQHGGEIWATSRPGEGATFTFTLPQADAPCEAGPRHRPVGRRS